jgi:hypothetical protein
LEIVQNEHRIPELVRIASNIDEVIGVSGDCDRDTLMSVAVTVNYHPLLALSGFAHLVLAEHMHAEGCDLEPLNREIDKAESLLHYLRLGGNHPWLPRAQWLKRRVNWKDYLMLLLRVFMLLGLILFAAFSYRFFDSHDISFL